MNKMLYNYMKNGSNKYLELPIVFDYDGVLFEARWNNDTLNMKDETLDKLIEVFKRGKNLHTEPILGLYNVLKDIKGPIFVLSHMHHEIEFNHKRNQIAKYFDMIPQENIFYASSIMEDLSMVGLSKIEYLEKIYRKYNGFVYIDDNHPNLMKMESYFWDRKDDCHFFHVSSLYV